MNTLNPNANYNREIVRAPRGTDRRSLPLNQVVVPDMWHLHLGMNELAEDLAALDNEEDEANYDKLVNLRDALMAINPNLGWLADAATIRHESKNVKEVWNLAHDFRANLAGDV